MELELGFKLTRPADEFSSDFQISKDRAGPLFLSHETDALFVLTAHLKGYERKNIKIDINEDGNLIGISGKKQVQETVMVGWRVYKNDKETKRFKKVFRIPEGVILDKIKARFDEDEATLKISMPKKVKGIRGQVLEEVKETEELVRGGSANLQIVDEQAQRTEGLHEEKDENMEARRDEGKTDHPITQEAQNLEQIKPVREDEKEPDSQREDKVIQNEEQKVIEGPKSSTEELEPPAESQVPKEETENQNAVAYISHERAEIRQDDEQERQVTESDSNEEVCDEARGDDPEKRLEKRFKICTPIVASSAILISLVVLVFQVIRSKNQTNRRKD